MSDEHTSLIGSAYNDGYDEGYKDGAAAAFKRVHEEALVLDQRGQRILAEIEAEFG